MSSTFPRLLWGLARLRPHETALQEKRYGVWQPTTWAAYAQRVRHLAHGLSGLGIGRGDVVAVLGDNRPEWFITELAAQALGAAVVGVYPTSIGEEVRHVLSTAEVRVVVAEDQEQVDKLVALRDRLPKLGTIVHYDPRGLEQSDEPYLRQFTDLEADGAADARCSPQWLDARVATGRPDETAVICITSGTTARLKLAELSHAGLLSMAERFTAMDPIRADDRYVSFLPMAWIGEQMLALGCGLSRGLTVSFPEDAATQRADLREIGPDVMFGPPPIWESMLSDVQARLGEAGLLKRRVFGWAHDIGDRMAAHRVHGRRPGPALRGAYAVASLVGLRPVRDQLGLARIRHCYTGGAPLSPDVYRFFHAIGVNLKQIYGQTEICGLAVGHRDDDIRFHTVGRPIPGTELRISDDGEILLRSDSVFKGYLHDAAATAAARDADGWLHTGDAGYVDDGHLVVIDRMSEVVRLPDGTRFSGAFIENRLKFSPYVAEAVAFHGPLGVTVLICVDPATVGDWAERIGLGYTTYPDLAGKPEVGALMSEEVARANADLPEAMRVCRFVVLPRQLDPDDDEITRTRKVRRRVVADRYGPVIGAMDRGDDRVDVQSTVAYADGGTTTRTLTLTIRHAAATGQGRHRPIWSDR